MAEYQVLEIEKALLAKGFKPHKTSGDHKYYIYEYDGKQNRALQPMLSRGSKSRGYGDSLLDRMKRQCGFQRLKQLKELIDCPLTKEAYKKYLLGQKLIEKTPDKPNLEEKNKSKTKSKKKWKGKKKKR